MKLRVMKIFPLKCLIFTSSNIRMKSSVVILRTRCEVDFHEIIILIIA